MLGSTHIAASRIGGMGHKAPSLPLGSGNSRRVFSTFARSKVENGNCPWHSQNGQRET